MNRKLVVYDINGEDITDAMGDDSEWLKDLINRTLESIQLDEIDQEVDRLILAGKQVEYYSDTIH
jgi:hypothetical protein